MGDIIFRKIGSDDNLNVLEEIQRDAWGIDDITIVPSHIMEAVRKFDAGFIVGAFIEEVAIAFLLALETRSKNIHYLHMIGVRPKYQGKRCGINIGTELMKYYGSQVSDMGIEKVEWTFDPLLSQNANLYFHKIGAIACKYQVAAYSQASEVGIYGGMPADRLIVEWNLKIPIITRFDRQNHFLLPAINSADQMLNVDAFRLIIPFDIQELKSFNMKEAVEVRFQTRKLFLAAFAHGFIITDFVCRKEFKENFYIFTK